jgi:hypothetical protein
MHVWLQHYDFSAEDHPDTSIEEALTLFIQFDWQHELTRLSAALTKQHECCDPGLGLVREDQTILHFCPQSPEVAAVFYHYSQSAKVFGMFPYQASCTSHANEFPLKRLREIFEVHYQNDQKKMLEILQPYSSPL